MPPWLLAGLGLMPGIGNSQLGGNLLNMFFSGENSRRYNEFQQTQVRPFNQMLSDYAGQVGRGITDQQKFADQGVGMGNELFGRNQAIGDFANFFSGINQSLFGMQNTAMNNNQRLGRTTKGIVDEFSRQNDAVIAGYQNQLGTARGLVNQMGKSERNDINNSFNAQLGQSRADLAARGLGSSTVRQSQTGAIEEGRQRTLMNANERQLGRQLGVEGQFGGAALAARASGASQLANLGFGRAGMLQAGNQFATNTGMGALGMLGNNMGFGMSHLSNMAQNQMGNMLNFGNFGLNSMLGGTGAIGNLMSQYILNPPPMIGGVNVPPSVR